MIHPWRRLRALTEVTLEWHEGGDMGFTDFDRKVISIRRGMTQAERRCTVMHEVLHWHRGPVTVGMADHEEVQVRKETARLLLPTVKLIGDAYEWACGDDEAAADDLWVDVHVLRDRMTWMTHPGERGYLARRFDERQEW